MVLYWLIILFIILIGIPILVVLINWHEAKIDPCANTHVTFKTFEKFYNRFPDKWFLGADHVELDYYISGQDPSAKSFLWLYFKTPIDYFRYRIFKDKYDKEATLEREANNYDEFVQAFRKLEEWEQKNG